jgi:succinate dehydrogenase / fumarate reductase cytochrome b subunit
MAEPNVHATAASEPTAPARAPRWLAQTLSSSIGRKLVMAVTGLGLIGFLATHLAGNLLLYSDAEGLAYDEYERALTRNPALLFVAELALFALFATHVVCALRLAMANREARSGRYVVRASRGEKTVGSSSMLVTGLVVLVFLVIHLLDFRIAKLSVEGEHSMAAMVRARLSEPLGAGIYLLAMVALGIHLSHAFHSALHTLGVTHPRVKALLVRASWTIAIVLATGFASFPVYFLLAR